MRRDQVTLDGDGLAIRTTFYSRKLGWSELQLPQARVVDLDEHTELQPMLKTNGTSLPGLRSGWFRLRNRHKALVAMGRGPRVQHGKTSWWERVGQSVYLQGVAVYLQKKNKT